MSYPHGLLKLIMAEVKNSSYARDTVKTLKVCQSVSDIDHVAGAQRYLDLWRDKWRHKHKNYREDFIAIALELHYRKQDFCTFPLTRPKFRS